MTKLRILLVVSMLLVLVAALSFDVLDYLSLEFYQQQQNFLKGFVRDNLALSVVIFLGIYVTSTAISLPVAAIMALVSGALFGVWLGTAVISVASTSGATLAFLVSRFLLQELVEQRFPTSTTAINRGIERDGAYYLFCIRLVPAFPYFVVNMVMGLTRIRVWTFAWVTMLGLLPITLVLTNAGEQISLITSVNDIMSPTLVGSLILIGIFPLIAKKLMDRMLTRQSA
ncbi:MAG: TVP38/TMEM64 family protein [Gammaproteobacteria bacterium]|jgi:uncharacterized membrane protein YdjX (TVP38/TMEM64 family)